MYNTTLKILSILLFTLLLAGCYHAKITTGEPSSTEVYENKWAASWIGGLVPPEAVDVEKECPNGVAMVETKHSFLNMLVGALTGGIFTPMQITVTCADAGAVLSPNNEDQNMVSISENALEQDFIQGLQQAADQAASTGKPVLVRF